MPRGVRLAPGANLLEPPDLPSASRFVQGKDTAARKIAFFIALLGVSVVVSGLADRVEACARRAGLRRHTTEWSLGVFGRTDLLPDAHIMEITTMCGHGMVSAEWVRLKAQLIRRGNTTAEEGARELARSCVCGVFNLDRAAKLLAAMAGEPAHAPVRAYAGQTVA